MVQGHLRKGVYLTVVQHNVYDEISCRIVGWTGELKAKGELLLCENLSMARLLAQQFKTRRGKREEQVKCSFRPETSCSTISA
jgi:hypothetical protein